MKLGIIRCDTQRVHHTAGLSPASICSMTNADPFCVLLSTGVPLGVARERSSFLLLIPLTRVYVYSPMFHVL